MAETLKALATLAALVALARLTGIDKWFLVGLWTFMAVWSILTGIGLFRSSGRKVLLLLGGLAGAGSAAAALMYVLWPIRAASIPIGAAASLLMFSWVVVALVIRHKATKERRA